MPYTAQASESTIGARETPLSGCTFGVLCVSVRRRKKRAARPGAPNPEETMIVTGYKFQHALRELGHRRDNAAAQFKGAQFAFEGDSVPDPKFIMMAFSRCDEAIARLQTAQQEYNLDVMVQVDNASSMTLCQAVKMVGGAGRIEKMWRLCAGHTGRNRYEDRELSRDATQVRAKRQVSVDDAMREAHVAAKFASALRTAVSIGNATEREMNLDPSLFE